MFYCLSFVVEVGFVSSVLATRSVSLSNNKEWPEGRTAGVWKTVRDRRGKVGGGDDVGSE